MSTVVKQVLKTGRGVGVRCWSSLRSAASSYPPLVVGSVLSRSLCFSERDVKEFARLTGDGNLLHARAPAEATEAETAGLVEEGAREDVARGVVVPGALLASAFPALLGSARPGSVYASQTSRFRAPVRSGDPLECRLRVVQVSGGGSRLKIETTVWKLGQSEKDVGNRHRTLVVDGHALALLPTIAKPNILP